jgi:dihydroxyacetone kinase phosphotransfer subunit
LVGLIIVSHSDKLATGIKEIADQMGNDNVKIIAVGGLEDNVIGTDPNRIKLAIEEMTLVDNILVFADLGSAVMSSEMAIELLEENMRNKVRLVDAPIVEGVILATVQATITNDINNIIETAQSARNMSKF